MKKKLNLRLLPSEAHDNRIIQQYIASAEAISTTSINGFNIIKRSIDARSRTIYYNLSIEAFINEPFQQREKAVIHFPDVHHAKEQVIIIGAGPAGLFAALQLLEKGIKPIIVERGKDVRSRRKDLAILNKEGHINPESNYCFGEGGAGTYSDGKLYTRSNKRGSIDRILNLFVQFGAEENILVDAHPHIGTNKLPHIITAMRESIIMHGGEVRFEAKMTDLIIDKDSVTGIVINHHEKLYGDAVILATGHSARDVFQLLKNKHIAIESKPFALGVRAEHPQALIDSIQYHCDIRNEYLPPASYSLVEQVAERGVFSFCMCPGGIIAPAATSPNELVVNGWSPSKRNNPFANSGIVVQVDEKQAFHFLQKEKKNKAANEDFNPDENDPLLLMHFQQQVEQKAYIAGGGNFVAPAQRLYDFVNKKISASLPGCSYLPGIKSADIGSILPLFIYETLQEGFKSFGKKMKGYLTNDAVIVAAESRTSSPVRIPRNADTLEHTQVKNLYPCAEGAGYAGGIVSAAMDGEKIALLIAEKIKR